jgi:hypothetical protein
VKAASGFAIVTVVVLVGALSAFAAPRAQTLTFESDQVSLKQVGSRAVIKDNDMVGSRKIGHDQLTCTQAHCVVVFSFAGGNVTGGFATGGKTSGTGTVTGGTGSYAKAMGSFAWKNLNSKGTRTSVVLKLM